MKWEQPTVPIHSPSETYLKLRALTGFPTRLTLQDPDPDQINKIPGILERVVVTGMFIDLEMPLTSAAPDREVQLEILSKHALVECTARISYVDGFTRLYLQLPNELQTVQRRRHPRADVQLEARMQPASSDEILPIQVVNISAGGAAFSSYTPREVGSVVKLHLSALGLAPAEIPALVLRCTAVDEDLWVVGVSFQALNPAQQAKIAQYVSALIAEVQP